MAGSVSPHMVSNGLIYCLDAGNQNSYVSGSSIWYDISKVQFSGSYLTGSLQAGAAYNATGSIAFNNNYVDCGRLAVVKGLTNASWEIWFYANTVTPADYNSLWIQYDGGLGGWYLYASGVAGYGLLWGIGPGSGVSYFGINTIPLQRWNHMVMVFDGGQPTDATRAKMYLNGVLQTADAWAGGAIPTTVPDGTTTYNTWLGKSAFINARPFDGLISTARIYNRALTPQEVLQNYNALKKRYNLN